MVVDGAIEWALLYGFGAACLVALLACMTFGMFNVIKNLTSV